MTTTGAIFYFVLGSCWMGASVLYMFEHGRDFVSVPLLVPYVPISHPLEHKSFDIQMTDLKTK